MKSILDVVTQVSISAGEILKGYFKAEYEIKDKGFFNPVTTADYASNEYIEHELRDKYPDYGWLSEETIDSDDRLSMERVWVVDPLDGTKEFIEGVPQFVVSIALTENGKPVLGVLHNPMTGETFTAAKGLGARLNGEPIQVSQASKLSDAVIFNSRSETRRGEWKPFNGQFKELRPIGSVAYKLGLVAANKGDMFATLKPKSEWDICAGHCILNEAGANLCNVNGTEISYNEADVIRKPGLVAGNQRLVESFLQLYQESR
jgi:myo-inositol-1(or 4)-monophosphatase